MAGVLRTAWRIAAGVVAAVIILAAILVGLVRLALVQAPEYREQVESWAGEALGWPVAVAAMDARLGRRGPELRFEDVSILTQDRERTLVRAAAGTLSFDAWALVRGRLLPGELRFSGVALRVERSVEGRWRLLGEAGPALGDGAPGEAAVPSLAELPPARARLEQVELEFEDLQQGTGPWVLALDELDIELRDGRLALALSGRLPAELGEEFALSAAITGQDERGRPSEWNAGASLSALALAPLARALGEPAGFPAAGELEGHLSVAAEAGQPVAARGEIRLAGLVLPGEAGPSYATLGGEFDWRRLAAGWDLEVSGLEVRRIERAWTSERLALSVETGEARRQLSLSADTLWLEDLAPLAVWLAGPPGETVEALAPEGLLRGLEANITLPLRAVDEPEESTEPVEPMDSGVESVPALFPAEFRLAVSFDDLAWRAGERWPGGEGLSGELDASPEHGSGRLDSGPLALDFPWLFRDPLALENLAAAFAWRHGDDGLEIEFSELAAANADLAVSGQGSLRVPGDDGVPWLEIAATARDVRLAAGPRYLPVGIMPEAVVAWLDAALLDGEVEEARFVFDGPTRGFPFREEQGLFLVEFDLSGGALDFEPGWPNASGLDAGIRFENEGFFAEVRSARLLEVEAGPVQVTIPDLGKGELRVQGVANGSLAALQEFALAAELLEELLGAGLAPAEITTGRASAEVDLYLPLTALAESRARVDLDIRGGAVAYGFLGEPLRDIRGRISIDNARVTAEGITATLAGAPLAADISAGEDGAIRIDGGGRLSAAGLGRVLRMPLDAWSEGETQWQGFLRFPAPGSAEVLTLELASQLEGIAIALPEPFAKRSGEARELRFRAEFPAGELMDMRFDWADSLRVLGRLDHSGPEAALLPVPGGLPGEPPGLVFSGAVSRLDLGDWLAIDWPDDLETEGLHALVAGGRMLVGTLEAPLLRASDLLLDLQRDPDGWRMSLAADRVAGDVAIPYSLFGDQPLRLRLDRLWLEGVGDESAPESADAAAAVESEAEAGELPAWRLHPAQVPPMDVEIEDLRFGEIRFGSVSARVLHEGDGIELIGLEAIGEDFIIQASGRSRLSDTVDESWLRLGMRSEHVGRTLGFMGYRRSMEAREAVFDSEVHWTGGLRGDWLEALEGEASITIRDGTLVGVEPGAGRIFGLLSIQALPRRLALDFKDVFGEGTAFDRISGDFRFEGGNAHTENLLMRGPSADIVVVGRVGLVARDYDQTAVIGADLGRTLPVAGAVVGGPAVGAALYLLSEMLRKPFQTQLTYRLTGTWDNPVVERPGATPRQENPAPREQRDRGGRSP